VIDKLSQTLAS